MEEGMGFSPAYAEMPQKNADRPIIVLKRGEFFIKINKSALLYITLYLDVNLLKRLPLLTLFSKENLSLN